MAQQFNISNDGTIFSITNDGTICRIAKISPDGKVEGKYSSKGVLWCFLILSVAVSLVLGIMMASAKSEYQSDIYQQAYRISALEASIATLKQENTRKDDELQNISSAFPFKISRIDINNTNSGGDIIQSSGSSMYADNIRYLQPKIHYTGYVSDRQVTIYYEIYNPNGTLKYNTAYSSVYTGDGTSVTIRQGSNTATLKGWGNPTTSTYASGTYRIEIWYNGMCLGTKTFTLY